MTTSVVTGASRGIGLELARQLSQRGDKVITTCRKLTNELASLDVQVVSDIELTSDASIDKLTQALKYTSIDLLIHNAGVLQNDSLETLEVKSILNQFEVNALAPLRVTHALLPNLKTGAKIAFISSRAASISLNTSGDRYGYRASKSALNMIAKTLAIDLKPHRIGVGVFHPGWVATQMTHDTGPSTTIQAASSLIDRINELNTDERVSFRHANGGLLSW